MQTEKQPPMTNPSITKLLQRQIANYERQSREYREKGVIGMADYFAKRAREERAAYRRLNYGLIDFALDVVFDSKDNHPHSLEGAK